MPLIMRWRKMISPLTLLPTEVPMEMPDGVQLKTS